MEVRAVAKIFWSAPARTPGVDATGASGGGDGDAEVRDGIMWLNRLVKTKGVALDVIQKVGRIGPALPILAFVYSAEMY